MSSGRSAPAALRRRGRDAGRGRASPRAGSRWPGVGWSSGPGGAPAGWIICDGSGGSPDLRGRFVLGWGGSRPFATAGGAETHTLTEAEMPNHSHNVYNVPVLSSTWGDGDYQNNRVSSNTNYTTDARGGNQPHNNMPPYFVLVYIYKT